MVTTTPNTTTTVVALWDPISILISSNSISAVNGMYTGVGYSLNAKLSSLGVSTCSDLQKLPLALLQKHCGTKTGQTLYNSCRGSDDRTFRTGAERKSVSAEMNYGIRFSTVCSLLMHSVSVRHQKVFRAMISAASAVFKDSLWNVFLEGISGTIQLIQVNL